MIQHAHSDRCSAVLAIQFAATTLLNTYDEAVNHKEPPCYYLYLLVILSHCDGIVKRIGGIMQSERRP